MWHTLYQNQAGNITKYSPTSSTHYRASNKCNKISYKVLEFLKDTNAEIVYSHTFCILLWQIAKRYITAVKKKKDQTAPKVTSDSE